MSEGLYLCNKLIAGTEIQDNLIQFKISRNIYAESPEELGRVGRHYWNFLKKKQARFKGKTWKKICHR